MFIFKYETIMNAYKEYALDHYNIISKISSVINKNEGVKTASIVKPYFADFNKISIDFAIMEHAKNISVIPSSFGWNDVGSYQAFEELFDKDENGNVSKNINYINVDSSNNIIVGDSTNVRVSLLGVHDMIIAINKNEVLICEKSKSQEIKKIIKLIS